MHFPPHVSSTYQIHDESDRYAQLANNKEINITITTTTTAECISVKPQPSTLSNKEMIIRKRVYFQRRFLFVDSILLCIRRQNLMWNNSINLSLSCVSLIKFDASENAISTPKRMICRNTTSMDGIDSKNVQLK